MKKKGANLSGTERARRDYAQRVQRRRRRLIFRSTVVMAILVPLVAVGWWQYEQRAAERRDLSVIGAGMPTLVQVYDRGCAECRQLRGDVRQALKPYENAVRYRLADRSTGDGALLASRHDAGHLSLLYFRADGSLARKENDPAGPDAIRQQLRRAFPAIGQGR